MPRPTSVDTVGNGEVLMANMSERRSRPSLRAVDSMYVLVIIVITQQRKVAKAFSFGQATLEL